MPRRILRVALTGGIATGKSHCLSQFARLGAPTIDADALAREAVAPGSPGFDAVLGRFGTGVLGSDGQLNREELGRLVFADADARRDLEAIIHPIVYSEIERWFAGLARDADSDPSRGLVAIADIPLLYETGREADFDRIIVAACRPEQQLERLVSRPGISAEDAERRIRSQIPIEDKARRADYVIDTSGSHAETAEQIESLWKELLTGE